MEPFSLAQTSSSVPQEKFHVLVGVTGSVAALKLPLLISGLLEIPGLEVKVVTTERAKHFYKPQEIPVTLYSDEDEWQLWKGRSDPVLHIELRRWADLMLVAPLDANTLAKLANGICDNLLTCVIRAWDLHKPLLFCPAMNTAMWEHPITAQQVEQLKGFGYTEIPCVVKKLVCGDEAHSLLQELLPRIKLVQIQSSFLSNVGLTVESLEWSWSHGRSVDHSGEREKDPRRTGLASTELIACHENCLPGNSEIKPTGNRVEMACVPAAQLKE
ncbi:phosphopantothenoylcysteine decarboxylase isoform X1 [Tympanuchus pallidicinctus]|uniref:phosphopantothenoylcysteine decarboxylase isoform X1 n=1 Tax=Tympanuchus pallidicinctus TaxID=109042 RepID=UPI002287267A|nr:phosphopantothenoylcysteine decarboxylase isoform X1 [Tympanuchus pallidicinctus]XP_052527721.1 phosphopantothenoylcysteine decarboxylase isoform X1 [Tympanuchus pallidicinctus]XP_052527722.1 phosphopantothenoylcysteine decarboxylase isoform X1 [Tympanuchus pallidicinctus]XP_052527723.1 phosphopantothenoylcysteine decarboxylase isoform X1 [Tympanuchus pallidicinctus]